MRMKSYVAALLCFGGSAAVAPAAFGAGPILPPPCVDGGPTPCVLPVAGQGIPAGMPAMPNANRAPSHLEKEHVGLAPHSAAPHRRHTTGHYRNRHHRTRHG
jgi:hypothetical protein